MNRTTTHRVAGVRAGTRLLAGFAAVAAGALLWSAPAVAQSGNGSDIVNFIVRDDGSAMQLSARPRGFNLFAEEDLAGTALRTLGLMRYPFINAGGICPFARTGGDIFNTACGTTTNDGGSFFHVNPVWAVGIEEYRKIREVWPGIAGMQSPVGYAAPWRMTSIPPITIRINAADGQFGRFFSGAVSDNNGSDCRAFTGNPGGGLPNNFTLLAASDCEQTWAATGFDGIRQITDQQWLDRFNANKDEFTFDSHKITPLPDAPVVGSLASYGAFSDHTREVIQLFGGVTPKGVGPSRTRGFPLGIYVRADAFKFDRPSVRDGVFIRWLVINRSEDVWNQGIDYDALYMGVDPGYVIGSNQSPNVFNSVVHGTHMGAGGGLSGNCSSTYPRRMPPGNNQGCDTRNQPRFLMILKSPIGDLKNKLYSNPESPFYHPTHRDADDTITYNHWRSGGFGFIEQLAWRRSDRALYGLLSGRVEDFLDGRERDFMSAGSIWGHFRYEGTDGTNNVNNWQYNRSVPSDIVGYGKWDYNDDGIPDTLMLPECGVQGCSRIWSDTIAGGYSTDGGRNIGNFLGWGPFALKAGDTAEVLWYLGTAVRDTLRANALLNNVISTYYNNFAGASEYPAPTITASDIQIDPAWFRDSTDGEQTTNIRIQIRMPSRQDDVFLKGVVELLEGNDPRAINLRTLNGTGFIDEVKARMRQNLAEVLVFLSCDNGVSWTSSSSDDPCTGNNTQTFQTRDEDGAPIGQGWRPRFRITADPVTGALSQSSISEEFAAGREYLFSFVTKTRSLKDILLVTEETTSGGITTQTRETLQDVFSLDIDTLTSALKTSGPTTAQVYAPLSVPAGTIYARLDTARLETAIRATNRVGTTTRRLDISGVFRMRFGNRFIITRTEDTVSGAVTSRVVRQSVYALASSGEGAPIVTDFVASEDVFSSNAPFTFSGPTSNQLSTVPTSVVGSVKTYVDTIRSAGYVIGDGGGGSQPYYVAVGAVNSTNFLGGGITQSTVDYETAPQYPGFTVTVTTEATAPGARLSRVIRNPATNDTLNSGVTSSNGVVYQTASSASTLFSPGGYYKLRWRGDAHGIRNNQQYRLAPSEVLQPQVDAALAARPVASVGLTDETLRALPNFPGGAAGTRVLVAARAPFQVIGISGEPADFVMFQRHASGNVTDSLFRNSRLWGNGGDTVRVQIPPDAWMPGDTIWVIENVLQPRTFLSGDDVVTVVPNTSSSSLPVEESTRIVGLKMVQSCNAGGTPTRITCNPIALGTLGSTGYLPFDDGYESVFHINRAFDQNSEVQLTAQPLVASGLTLTKRDMSIIEVVPNPYIVQGAFDRLTTGRAVAESRIMFVNVPAEGLIRIYSISGQLMQQLSWTKEDLQVSANGSAHGDLPYNLRTREGLDLGPGLYLYVLTARGETANGQVARGKFVIIR